MTELAELQTRRLRRLQVGSGALFALFLAVHLVNQAAAVLGAQAYDATQAVLRRGYQAPVVELLAVFLPLATHVVVSVRLALRRRSSGAAPVRSLRLRAHRWSGWFMAVVFVGHVAATRGADFFAGAQVRFAALRFTFEWVPGYFWPYYTALGLAGAFHLLHGLTVASAELNLSALARLRSRRVFGAVSASLLVLMVSGVLSLGAVARTNADPGSTEYAKLVRSLLERLEAARR